MSRIRAMSRASLCLWRKPTDACRSTTATHFRDRRRQPRGMRPDAHPCGIGRDSVRPHNSTHGTGPHVAAVREGKVVRRVFSTERAQSWVVDYGAARARAIEWLGDRYLLAKPVNAAGSGRRKLPRSLL